MLIFLTDKRLMTVLGDCLSWLFLVSFVADQCTRHRLGTLTIVFPHVWSWVSCIVKKIYQQPLPPHMRGMYQVPGMVIVGTYGNPCTRLTFVLFDRGWLLFYLIVNYIILALVLHCRSHCKWTGTRYSGVAACMILPVASCTRYCTWYHTKKLEQLPLSFIYIGRVMQKNCKKTEQLPHAEVSHT